MARANTAWGLDVGVTSLKAVKLRREGGAISVEAFDVVEHDRFLTEPDVDRDETIRHTLAKFMERHALKGEAVFLGVPGASTFARFVKLPPVEAKKIPEIVKFEAIQQIPFPLEQVNWDYQTFTQPDSPEVEVGIFAMKKELVAHVMSNFQTSSLRIEGVQMSPLAVFNAVSYDEMTEGKGTIVLDIGAEHTDLIFVDGGKVWLRTINIGGNNFTDSLSKNFKVPFAKAEQLKRTAATSKYAKQIFQAMRPVFVDLVAEIQRSKGYYDSSHRESMIERIIGLGNSFKLPNLQKYIQQEMKMEVVRLENLKKIQVDGKLAPGLHEHILALGGATGLALQGLEEAKIDINLLPLEIARQMLWRQKRPMFAAAAALIVAGVGVAGFTTFQQDQAVAKASDDVTRDYKPTISEFQTLSNAYSAIPDSDYRNAKNHIDALTLGVGGKERTIWPQLYVDIINALPQSNGNINHRLVVKSIHSAYSNDVLNATITSTVSNAGNAGGFGGGGMPAPPGFGMPPGVPLPPGMSKPAGGANGGGGGAITATSSGTGLRGFVIQLEGYTSYQMTGAVAQSPFAEFNNRLLGLAPQKSSTDTPAKPYYFQIDVGKNYNLSPKTFTPGTPGAVSPGALWGGSATSAPYYNVFSTELLGISNDNPSPNYGGGNAPPGMGMPFAPGGGGGVSSQATWPIDLDTKTCLTNYNTFTITLRAVIRDEKK